MNTQSITAKEMISITFGGLTPKLLTEELSFGDKGQYDLLWSIGDELHITHGTTFSLTKHYFEKKKMNKDEFLEQLINEEESTRLILEFVNHVCNRSNPCVPALNILLNNLINNIDLLIKAIK